MLEEHFKPITTSPNFCKERNLICIFSRHQTLFFITTRPCNFIDYCITKLIKKESLNNLSVDHLAMTLYEHLCNQAVDILKIFAILKGINRDAVNGKSKDLPRRIAGCRQIKTE